MEKKIPDFLNELLKRQYDEATVQKIIAGYQADRAVTLRVNTLKTDVPTVKAVLSGAGIAWKEVAWSEEALILEGVREEAVRVLSCYERGEIYLQSLSSMIPALFMEPKAGESILDMAAAPGGKTTQMAALSGGKAQITACEKNKIRADRLQYNIDKQGASRVFVMVEDARKLDDFFSFDKILLDAPCSGSGTLTVDERGVKEKFSKELVTRSAKTQEEMLRKAIRLLKPGHEMVYSTCSILEAENEDSLKKVLGKQAEVVPIFADTLPGVPLLPSRIPGTLCICPDGLYEGFYVAKIRKQ